MSINKFLESENFDKLNRMKDIKKQVLIGQKIPIGVPLFSPEDI